MPTANRPLRSWTDRYKPDGKVTLVPDSDKREAVKTATAEADFKED